MNKRPPFIIDANETDSSLISVISNMTTISVKNMVPLPFDFSNVTNPVSLPVLRRDTKSSGETGSDVENVNKNPGDDLVSTETTSVWDEKIKMDRSGYVQTNDSQVAEEELEFGRRIPNPSKSLPPLDPGPTTTISANVHKKVEVDPFDPDAFMLERPVGTLDDTQEEYELEVAGKIATSNQDKTEDTDAGDHLTPVSDKNAVLLPFPFKEYGIKKNQRSESKTTNAHREHEQQEKEEYDVPRRAHSTSTERTKAPKTSPPCTTIATKTITPNNRDSDYSDEERTPKVKKPTKRNRSRDRKNKSIKKGKNYTTRDYGVIIEEEEVTRSYLDTLENQEITPTYYRSEKETYVPSSQPYYLPRMQLSFAPPSLEEQEDELQDRRAAQIPTKLPGIHLPIASITLSSITQDDVDSREILDQPQRTLRSEPTLEDENFSGRLHHWHVNYDYKKH